MNRIQQWQDKVKKEFAQLEKDNKIIRDVVGNAKGTVLGTLSGYANRIFIFFIGILFCGYIENVTVKNHMISILLIITASIFWIKLIIINKNNAQKQKGVSNKTYVKLYIREIVTPTVSLFLVVLLYTLCFDVQQNMLPNIIVQGKYLFLLTDAYVMFVLLISIGFCIAQSGLVEKYRLLLHALSTLLILGAMAFYLYDYNDRTDRIIVCLLVMFLGVCIRSFIVKNFTLKNACLILGGEYILPVMAFSLAISVHDIYMDGSANSLIAAITDSIIKQMGMALFLIAICAVYLFIIWISKKIIALETCAAEMPVSMEEQQA